jgi:integrase
MRIERGIYRRPTGVLEVGFRDDGGLQRWRTVHGGILAARRLRDELSARRARGESVAPSPRLRFGEAAERWLSGPVLDLRDTTQVKYQSVVKEHLWPRFATRRLDGITADDLALLVREMRAATRSEATIAVVLAVVGRIYKFAVRRLGWNGTIPTTLMLSSERPKISQAKRRPIFSAEELEQTIRAASADWADVRIEDLDEAEMEFSWQVDRHGRRRPTKSDGSARTVPIPRDLALVVAKHKLAASRSGPEDFVFATRTGRPLQQRNVSRALREAQRRAVDLEGRPTYPILHEIDANGRVAPIPRGTLPSMHSFRHSVASRALLAGESVDEVAFLLGHRDGTVTRTVYVREVADARRRVMRRSRMAAEYAGVLRTALNSDLASHSDEP